MVIRIRRIEEAPPQPPVVIGPDQEVAPLAWTWTGANGDSWDLTDWESPVIKLRGAQAGAMPPVSHFYADSPALDGSAWEGARYEKGQLFLPLMVRGESSVDFIEQNRRFLRSLNPKTEGVARVTHPGGVWRELRCRYASGADLTIDLDPVKARRLRYGITWDTADPLWYGKPVEKRFDFRESTGTFFPGPPFLLMSGNILEVSKIVNPGDEPAYPRWRMTGPFSGFTVGVGDAVVDLNVPKGANQWVEIDMRPRRGTILAGAVGSDVVEEVPWSLATNVRMAAIPSGQVDLTTELRGAGVGSSASLWFEPRFWGFL